jgi:hypothetical protein
MISIRQVDIQNGRVPLEFALEKTFALYDKELMCNAMHMQHPDNDEKKSAFWLEPGIQLYQKMPFPDGDKYLRMPEDFPTSYMV